MSEDRVSVVMITHNRGGHVRIALEHLLLLPEKPHIIVVDNGSSDETVNIVRSLDPSIHVVSLGRNLGAAGRYIGLAKATTPYVAFSDDDSWWAPGSLARAAHLLDSDPDLGLIAARILVGAGEQLDPICRVMTARPFSSDGNGNGDHHNGSIPIVSFVACGAVVRREAFLEAGGFEQRFGVGGEEQLLALDLLRNGWRLAYVHGVLAHHYPSSLRDVTARRARQVQNALWSAWLGRPATSALAATWRFASCSFTDQACRAGFLEAVGGLQWVLRARDPVPAGLDRKVRLAEEVFYASRLDDHG